MKASNCAMDVPGTVFNSQSMRSDFLVFTAAGAPGVFVPMEALGPTFFHSVMTVMQLDSLR